MSCRHELIVDILSNKLKDEKIGILIKGIINIEPERIVNEISTKLGRHIHAAIVGYEGIINISSDSYTISREPLINDLSKYPD